MVTIIIILSILTVGFFSLILLAPISLMVNTQQQKYLFCLAWVFRIHYEDQPEGQQRGFRFFLFGYSWFRKLKWPRIRMPGWRKRSGKQRQKPKENQSGHHLKWGYHLKWVLNNQEILLGLLHQAKISWYDLQRLSDRRLEASLCTPDFMTNALLSLILTHWEAQGGSSFGNEGRQGIYISVNYLEENWLILHFVSHLWVILWVSCKFALSWPVLRLGYCLIRGKIKYLKVR